MKKIAVVMGIILALGLETEAYAKEINLKLGNNTIKTQVSPIQKFGTTLVPIRVVVDNLGAEIE